MEIAFLTALVKFANKHPEARAKLELWKTLVKACNAKDFNELKKTFGAVDYVPKNCYVFDVGGNNYRIVADVNFVTQRVLIKEVLTHADYDKWTQKNRGK